MPELYIETHGHGDAHVVLLHGWAMHGGVFAPLTDLLARQATVHVVDLPGHGYSRASRVPLEPAACARAIVGATPPALWLGWSLGGLIALNAALDHPRHVQALAMVGASPCFVRRPDWRWGMASEVLAGFGHELDANLHAVLDRFLALEALGSDHARADMRRLRDDVFARGTPDPHKLHEGLQVLAATDLRARLPGLAQPSAWISGARDRLIPAQAMQWSAAACGGTYTRIEHAGHAPFIGFADEVMAALAPLMPRNASHRKQA